MVSVGINIFGGESIFSDFPIHVELEKYSPRYTQEMKPLGY